MGALKDLAPVLFIDTEMLSKKDFPIVLGEAVALRDQVRTFVGDHKEGRGPVGFVGQTNPVGSRLVVITEFIWFPWSSPRNRLESVVNYINELRDDYTITAYADDRNPEMAHDGGVTKPFYETICKHNGIMRHVGKVHDLFGVGGTAAMYQSRRRKN